MEILYYTRKPLESPIYADKLAHSMHLAYRQSPAEPFTPFHHNEGLLYVRATQNADGTLNAKTLLSPCVFPKKDGGFGVLAIRTEPDGTPDAQSAGCVLLWESADLVRYREVGLVRLFPSDDAICQISCEWDSQADTYLLHAEKADGEKVRLSGDPFRGEIGEPHPDEGYAAPQIPHDCCSAIEGCCPCGTLTVPDALGAYLIKKLTVPKAAGVSFADGQAIVTYSDGTTVTRKAVRSQTGAEAIHHAHIAFPFAVNRADPCCAYWHGKYYFIATNDADGNHTLYIRCSDTLEGVTTAEEVLLLDSTTHPGIGGLLWAPEFHEIGGKLYIFHAATEGEFFREESRVMELREGGDPMCRTDWSAPHLVVKKDGSPLCEAGKVISLDMTTFEYEGKQYVMWSQRQFLPVDQGAWLYLAQINPNQPWHLVSDPVCVAMPEYSWENNHTFVVEGPYALWHDGKLMVTYSAAAVDSTYVVGMLTPRMGSDILDPANWSKSNFPLLSSRSVPGEFGPGHNSYVTDEDGLIWNFYHARPGVDGPRSSGIRRVHFDLDGEPMLDVTEADDLP